MSKLHILSPWLLTALIALPSSALAQETAEEKKEEVKEEAEDKVEEAKKDAEAKADEKKDEAKEAAKNLVGEVKKDAAPARQSSNGAPEWKPSWGGGLEVGFFFTELGRFNKHLLEPSGARPFDTDVALNLDLALEISPLEITRFTLFGGIQTPLTDDPGLTAYYVGVEPAFAFRQGMWEAAIGFGLGIGSANVESAVGSADADMVLMRPFLEGRRYLSDFIAAYLRVGFNYWHFYGLEESGLKLEQAPVFTEPNTSLLDEGGFYLALGVRFGSYPEHVKVVGDQDGDGILDDIDDCPDQPEDKDGFEDEDGCPEDDNDKDGIKDSADQCPLQPEDKDGWKDEDGCPEDDDDKDGDAILDKVDQCPDKPEDKDGWKDEDGCPEDDDDLDGDGILGAADKCPNEKGVPERQGCPFRRVEITEAAIVINEKVFFELNKATIKPESFGLLDEVADTLIKNPRIKLVEVQGHTDTAGPDAKNLKLSDARAKSVMDYLVSKGVAKERLVAKGYGESKPLVPTPKGQKETPEAAEQNRRVEFIILQQDVVTRQVFENEVEALPANPNGPAPRLPTPPPANP
jgi:outer membrane protein OmpA-like peptidoglycan-associated protein